ncbi:MAG: hypothetical protein JST00_40055 [Deltaproteobacteria bacterium]|nr:hypothetical protein [Deltaproteobacteria bacterium]
MTVRASSLFALAVLLAALSALAGCGHTETHAAMLRAPEPATSRTVELYLAEQATPARPYYDIAIVQAIGFGSDATPEDITRALTDKAGALGCDAVIRTTIDLGYSRAHASGVCVKYLGPGPAAPAPILPRGHGSNPSPPPMRPAPAPKIEALPSTGPPQR